jgi:hypothetical protein
MLIPFKSQRSHKTVEIKVYLFFLYVDGRILIRIRIRTNKLWIRMRIHEDQKFSDLDADPDPEHCS